LLANAFLQLPVTHMAHRIRQQAGSYSLGSRGIIYIGGELECGTGFSRESVGCHTKKQRVNTVSSRLKPDPR
jgi:hypothetical protein